MAIVVTVAVVLLVAGLCFSAWVLADLLRWGWSACQSLFSDSSESGSFCPAGGSPTEPRAPKHGAAVDHHDRPPAEQTDTYLTTQGRHLSSPLPASCATDLESVEEADRRDDFPHPLWSLSSSVILADISSSPDLESFGSGVEAGMVIVVVSVGAVALFGLFRWGLSRLSSGD